MTTEQKKSSAVSHTARNIIISVITTVLVSLAVYFLGFGESNDGPARLETEKATINAWDAYVTIENNYSRNAALLYRDMDKYGGFKGFFLETKKESEKFRANLESLITSENVDQDMIAVLKRRLKSEETLLPPTEKFYNEMDAIFEKGVDQDWTEEQLKDSLLACPLKHKDQLEGMLNRALTELEDLSKTLTNRYHRPFNSDDFYTIQVYKQHKDLLTILRENKNKNPVTRESLTGKWDVSGATVMLYADKKWFWFVPADSSRSEGSWDLKDGQFILIVEKNSKSDKTGTWDFEIIDVTENSLILHLIQPPNTIYTFVKK